MTIEGGRLLIVLGSGTPQTAAQLAGLARQDPGATLRRLQQLVDWGFIVADAGNDFALYQLSPYQDPPRVPAAARRILVIEDDLHIKGPPDF